MLPDFCCMGELLPHCFQVNGYDNWSQLSVVSLPQDRNFKEYSQAAVKTPLVSGRFPAFSGLIWTAYFHFLLVERKHVSVTLFEQMSLETWSPLF